MSTEELGKEEKTVEGSVSRLSGERRARTRYPVRLTVRYRSLISRQKCCGEGITVDMSSSSIRVQCNHHLAIGNRAEILVDWPSLLDSRVPLQLVLVGEVVRAEPTAFALRYFQHQFRTARSKPLPHPTVFRATA